MKNPERVAALIAELRTLTETDFERHRIDALEHDLHEPQCHNHTEEWRDVVGYEGRYKVSSLGRVKSFARTNERILTPTKMYDDYLRVVLSDCGKTKPCCIHRLVAEAFIPNPNNLPVVDHINGVKTDNRVENLEWVTIAENVRRAYKNGLAKSASGEDHCQAKLTNNQAAQIRQEFIPNDAAYGLTPLSKKYGVSCSIIRDIVRGKTYKNAQ